MAGLILPNRFKSQPQYAAAIDKGHPLAKDVTLFLNGAVPCYNSATGKQLTITGGGSGFSKRATSLGMSLYTPDGGWADIAVGQDWVGPNTLIMLCRVNAVDASFGGVFSKDSSGANTQFAVGRDSTSSSLYGAVENATAVSFGGASIPALTDFSVLAFTHSGAASSAMSYYRNGLLVGSTTALGTQNSGTGALGLGRSRDASASFDSDVDWIAFIRVSRVLSASEILGIGSPGNIWSMLQLPHRRVFVASSSGVSGSLATTNANDTSAASGSTTVTSSLAKTNANDTSSASGTTTVTGSLATTNANDTVNASGAVGSGVTGSVNVTNANDTLAASGTTAVTGSAAKANANDTGAASGTTTVIGSLSKANANDTLAASGFAGSVTGTVEVTNENDTLSARGTAGSQAASFSGGYGGVYISREDRAERRKKQRIELGIIKEEKAAEVASLNKFEISNLTKKRPVLGPTSNRASLAEKEALNAELRRLIDLDNEEQEILKILMSL